MARIHESFGLRGDVRAPDHRHTVDADLVRRLVQHLELSPDYSLGHLDGLLRDRIIALELDPGFWYWHAAYAEDDHEDTLRGDAIPVSHLLQVRVTARKLADTVALFADQLLGCWTILTIMLKALSLAILLLQLTASCLSSRARLRSRVCLASDGRSRKDYGGYNANRGQAIPAFE